MKKIISIAIVSSLMLSSCGSTATTVGTIKKDGKTVKTSKVTKDFFYEQIKLVGKVSPLVETSISSQVAGIIKNVNVDVGSEVKKGAVLANIDLGSSTYGASFNNANTAYNNANTAYGFTEESIKNDLESARIQLESAKTSKENTYATTTKQLELAQTQLKNIQKNQSNTEITTQESLKNSELMIDNAKTNFENFKKNSEENINSIYENLKITLSSALINIDSSITQADMILGVSEGNRNANDSYETYLGAKDYSIKSNAESALRELMASFSKNQDIGNIPREELDAKTVKILSQVIKGVALYDKITLTLNNSITSSSFSQTQLDGLSTTVSKYQSSLLQSQSQITSIKNTISTTNASIETSQVSLQNAINIAQAQLDNIKAGNNSQLDSINGNETLTQTQLENTEATIKQARDGVDNAVKIAQANYDSVQAKLNSQRVQTKSQVDQARGGKDIAGIQLNNTSIVAPFDGIITSKNIEIGSMVNPGASVFSIGENGKKKIKLEVTGTDYDNIKLGQNVKITETETSYSGIVSLISPNTDSQTKLYKVDVIVVSDDFKVNLGGYVDVLINKNLDEVSKTLSIPLSSIIPFDQGKFGVYIVNKDNTVKINFVTIGRKNTTMIEVLSGLNEGQEYVTEGALTLNDGDLIERVK